MKEINIARSIYTFRKEKGITQERLAEIVGVTVGAVSKWESGASIPDLAIIVELADFFETSVDVLLGYGWKKGGMGEAVKRIQTLRNEKRFDEAAAEAEKALERYPNSFDVAFAAAVMYSLRGVEQKNQKANRRALALFNRALELIAQNADERISEWSLRNSIALVYMNMGQTDRALEQMKKNNAGGLNDIDIGYTLAFGKRDADAAIPYLSSGLIANMMQRLRMADAYAAAYKSKGDFAGALAVLAWQASDVETLCGQKACYLNRRAAQLFADCAVLAARLGDGEGARGYLERAKAQAERFDASPVYGFEGMRFYEGGNMYAFDDFGETALAGIEAQLSGEDAAPALKIWKELCHGERV